MTDKTNGYSIKSDKCAQWEEVEVPVPWGHVSGKWWGSREQQPILTIHGWQDNAGSFDTLAPLLCEQGYSVYAIDFPGHGHSSYLPPGCSYYLFWDGVQIIRRIVKHFNWGKITLMGHSLGGGICFLYAATFPDEVENFISLDILSATVTHTSLVLNTAADCIDKQLKFEDPIYKNQLVYSYEDMVSLVNDAYKGALTRQSCEIMLRRGSKLADNGEGYIFRRDPRLKVAVFSAFAIEYSLEFAARIKCKVLYIKAADGLNLINAEEILDRISENAEKVVQHEVPGNHHVHLNDPDFISGIILDFLKS